MKRGTQNEVRKLRDRYGCRISEIAKAANVSWPTAQSWDLGRTAPSIERFNSLVTALKALKASRRAA